MHDCVRSQRRIEREKERERERETAEGGLPSCQGKEDGWGAGGWSWPRKKYGGFRHKIQVPTAFVRDLLVFMGRILWQLESRSLKQICPEKGLQNILKYND